MQKLIKIVIAGVCSSLIMSATVVMADGHGHGHGHDKHGKQGEHGKNKHHDYKFSQHDRVSVQSYMEGHYRSDCPPGLAKKHNGCMPPGQAKHYRVGYPLYSGIVYEPVPEPLLVQLQPVPMGYQYVMVDRDVLLISEASHKVIDAITLLSAVGH